MLWGGGGPHEGGNATGKPRNEGGSHTIMRVVTLASQSHSEAWSSKISGKIQKDVCKRLHAEVAGDHPHHYGDWCMTRPPLNAAWRSCCKTLKKPECGGAVLAGKGRVTVHSWIIKGKKESWKKKSSVCPREWRQQGRGHGKKARLPEDILFYGLTL